MHIAIASQRTTITEMHTTPTTLQLLLNCQFSNEDMCSVMEQLTVSPDNKAAVVMNKGSIINVGVHDK